MIVVPSIDIRKGVEKSMEQLADHFKRLYNPSIGIYFVVESKWGKADANLQEVETNKIECGKLHFKAVSEQIKFDWIKSYDDFKQKFGDAEDSGTFGMS